MRTPIKGLLLATGLGILSSLMPGAVSPANAQPAFTISFDAFHDQLNNYGDWLYSDRWGEVWRPWQQDQDPNWRPYTVGHWAFTDEYSWTWISDEGPWGDIAYHYGRWVFDPDDGWLWLTGYVWSPAWVVWRSAGPSVGWMPMPPDDAFLGFSSSGVSLNVSFGDWGDASDFYGYSRWYGLQFDQARFGGLWTFVPAAHIADPGYRTYVVPRPQVVNIVRNSVNITNYTIVNNVVVNKSVNVAVIQNAGGRPVSPVHAAAALHNTRWVAPLNQGQQVQAQMRQLHPRGNGVSNSAPPPTAAQVQGLSSRPIPAHGPSGGPRVSGHLFSKANIAQLKSKLPSRVEATPSAAGANLPVASGPRSSSALRGQQQTAEPQSDRSRVTEAPRQVAPAASRYQPVQPDAPSSGPLETSRAGRPMTQNPRPAKQAPDQHGLVPPHEKSGPSRAVQAPAPLRDRRPDYPVDPKPVTPVPDKAGQSPRPQSHPAPHPEEKHPEDRRDDNR